jgi:tetratricopeptide (TPR) repeat protein
VGPALAGLVAATGLLLVTVLAGVPVHIFQLRAALQRASDNEEAARRQQRLAAEHYRQARDAINRMLGRLDGRDVAQVPRLKELSQQQLEDALAFYQRALEGQDDPDPGVRLDTAVAYRRAADIQQTLGRPQAAADNYRRGIELLESLPAETRDAPANQSLLGGCYHNLAVALLDARRPDEGRGRWAGAAEDWDRVVELDAGDPSAYRVRRAVVLARSGDHARAAAEVAFLEAKPQVTADGLFDLARALAIATGAARDDARLSSAERADLAERYACRAVVLLRRLKERGYFKNVFRTALLLADPDWKPLRGRDDFKKALAPAGPDKPE